MGRAHSPAASQPPLALLKPLMPVLPTPPHRPVLQPTALRQAFPQLWPRRVHLLPQSPTAWPTLPPPPAPLLSQAQPPCQAHLIPLLPPLPALKPASRTRLQVNVRPRMMAPPHS